MPPSPSLLRISKRPIRCATFALPATPSASVGSSDMEVRARVQPCDRVGAPREDRALVEVALVGNLSGVDARWLRERDQPSDARARRFAGGVAGERVAQRADARARREEHERAELVAIVAR